MEEQSIRIPKNMVAFDVTLFVLMVRGSVTGLMQITSENQEGMLMAMHNCGVAPRPVSRDKSVVLLSDVSVRDWVL